MKVLLIVALMMSICLISVHSFCQGNCHSERNDTDYDPGVGECYCDYFCQEKGDCCSDFCQYCQQQVDPSNPICGVDQVLVNKVCQASSRAVPNKWCQTYCTFDANAECTGVKPHMKGICECHDFNRQLIKDSCKSLSPSVTDQWCATYCHINVVNGVKTCSVDAHMSSTCKCTLQ